MEIKFAARVSPDAGIDLWWGDKFRKPSHGPQKKDKKCTQQSDPPSSDKDKSEEKEEDEEEKLLLDDWIQDD